MIRPQVVELRDPFHAGEVDYVALHAELEVVDAIVSEPVLEHEPVGAGPAPEIVVTGITAAKLFVDTVISLLSD